MWRATTLIALAACARAHLPLPEHYEDITDVEYYSMPALFALDEYQGCMAAQQLYCLGSFEVHAPPGNQLYGLMKRYSANWVDRYNHTRLHRGVCLPRSCPHSQHNHTATIWFEECVNSTLQASHGLSVSLLELQYCRRAEPAAAAGGSAGALAVAVAAVLLAAALATAADLTLTDQKKKGLEWALAFSVPGCWRELTASGGSQELQIFDGLRVLCMLVVIVEHVCWLGAQTYVLQPRFLEQNRQHWEVMLLSNSTLVVQIFFMMSSFLLARKLQPRGPRDPTQPTPPPPPLMATLGDVMLNRFIRVSPVYWFVVWGAGAAWARGGGGAPLWGPHVGGEAAVCRRKWWTHLLYLNNVVYPDDKCLIQTWYLAADMQLYLASAVLLLCWQRWGGGARRGGGGGGALLWALVVAMGLALLGLLAAALSLDLDPTYVMHSPEMAQAAYSGSRSFNLLYQSPLGNVPGALAGLLLHQLHADLTRRQVQLRDYTWFRWAAWLSPPLGLVWLSRSPLLALRGGAARAAALAALERPVFSLLAGLAVLGALHGVKSPLVTLLSWPGWRVWSRLSFCALLLHLPLNKSVLATLQAPAQLDHTNVIISWFGVALSSYLVALPLCLLLELPAQRLHRALTRRPAAPAPAAPPNAHKGNAAPTIDTSHDKTTL